MEQRGAQVFLFRQEMFICEEKKMILSPFLLLTIRYLLAPIKGIFVWETSKFLFAVFEQKKSNKNVCKRITNVVDTLGMCKKFLSRHSSNNVAYEILWKINNYIFCHLTSRCINIFQDIKYPFTTLTYICYLLMLMWKCCQLHI